MPGTPRSPHHCLFEASSFSAETYSSVQTAADSGDEEEGYLETFESLKAAGASLSLHESPSCSSLLPCGLLPEELAELESMGTAAAAVPALHVEATAKALSSMRLEGGDPFDDVAAPLTPSTSHERALTVIALVSDADAVAGAEALAGPGAGTRKGAAARVAGAGAEVAPARVEPATEAVSADLATAVAN